MARWEVEGGWIGRWAGWVAPGYRIDEWMGQCVAEWVHEWMGGWVDGWVDGQMEKLVDGWVNGEVERGGRFVSSCAVSYHRGQHHPKVKDFVLSQSQALAAKSRVSFSFPESQCPPTKAQVWKYILCFLLRCPHQQDSKSKMTAHLNGLSDGAAWSVNNLSNRKQSTL